MRTLLKRHMPWVDILLLSSCPIIAYLVRFDGLGWSADDWRTLALYTLFGVPLKVGVVAAFGLYRRLWSHTGFEDLEAIVVASLASVIISSVLGAFALPFSGLVELRVPYSVLFTDGMLTLMALLAPRALTRKLTRRHRVHHGRGARRVLVAGAGTAGQLIVEEMHSNPQLGLVPVGFVDDDTSKHHQSLRAVPILGSLSEIPVLVEQHRVDEVIIAMPMAAGTVVRRVVESARASGVPARTVPGIFDILAGRVGVSKLRDVRIEDLLRREPVHADGTAVRERVTGRVVLVTGAGGSIGGELCRQLAELEPARLVLVGHGENSIFEISQELRRRFPALDLGCAIADVRNGPRIGELLASERPHAVFHAAAHKHVPLMEDNVIEAVTTNVIGTRNVAWAAAGAGVGHLVFVSTDKAVRPSSVMGATKRAAECIVQRVAAEYQRAFLAVRFGNVLGSRGSVVPSFLRQIRDGGPVLVTHPEMRRYFMTIPEAVQLVLQAGALGAGGEVFVLDMGEPVRIVDLATDLIRLSGFEPGRDIQLRFTGVRPGEKLYEEMFFDVEHAVPTAHAKVLCARNAEPSRDVLDRIEELIAAAEAGMADDALRELLRRAVPDFLAEPAMPRAASTARPERVVPRPPVTIADRLGTKGEAGLRPALPALDHGF